MKNIFLLLFSIFVANVSFTQQKPKTEPTEMSIPYDVAQKMLLDLNDYDRLKELSKLDKEEIKQLNNKIGFVIETTLKDAGRNGDLLIMTLWPENCKMLNWNR
jgi:hypothetical protein